MSLQPGCAFGLPQYVQYFLRGLTRVLLVFHSSLLTVNSSNNYVIAFLDNGNPCGNRPEQIVCIFLAATLITEVIDSHYCITS